MVREILANRYILQSPLGSGGMGDVYRAHDRLTGDTVALKRLPNTFAEADDTITTRNFKLALTREFQTIASLRHPHIISVLDYGFNTDGQPFFTMELLASPRHLRAYAETHSSEEKVKLLMQLLQALHYLHRRGIIHRDLKPENVLVTSDGRLRVLDFGLAQWRIASSVEWSQSGTLFYIAPEVLQGAAPTPEVDLYAVGVMAHELFSGRVPFKGDGDVIQLFKDIMHTAPDASQLKDCPIAPVIMRLLAKTAGERYGSALATIRAIEECMPQAATAETRELRESFLQAAEFVGREKEFAQLNEALAQAKQGRGQSWLIGGESGVGKTRLLDEVQVQALVNGFRVLRGQAVEGGGLPYQLWREPIRRLVLGAELSDLEAGILKPLVPDIALLLERDIPDVAELPGSAGPQRLALTIVDLFKRQGTPLLLLVEDLQWSDESLEPLRQLNRVVANMKMVIVGNYRDDEKPTLPQSLPSMQLMRLARLGMTAVAQLSESMLGEVGRTKALVELLQRETEGNTFFMVEVVRALAEEAGDLERIGQMALPHAVLAGGVQQVMRRRLARMPIWGRSLLKPSAVSGRQLDVKVLAWLDPQLDMEQWLNAGAEAAIFEVRDEQWQFSHQKLREALLDDLVSGERPGLHRQVAEAIEAIYPNDPSRVEVLLEHWRLAGDTLKEFAYLLPVAAQLVEFKQDYPRAITLLERGCELAAQQPTSAAQQIELYKWLGQAHERLGHYPTATRYLEQGLHLADQSQDQSWRAWLLHQLGLTLGYQGEHQKAYAIHSEELQLHRQSNDRLGIASCLNAMGIIHSISGDYERALAHWREALVIFRTLPNQRLVTIALNNIGLASFYLGQFAAAEQHWAEAVMLSRRTNDRRLLAIVLDNWGQLALRQGRHATALTYENEALALMHELNQPRNLLDFLSNLALIHFDAKDFDAAQEALAEGLRLAERTAAKVEILKLIVTFAQLFQHRGQLQPATQLAGFADAQTEVHARVRANQLEPLWKTLSQKIPAPEFAALLIQGRALTLAEVLQNLWEFSKKLHGDE